MSWHRHRAISQRIIVTIALGAYLLAAIGVPRSQRAGKYDGIAFPCQEHLCGCQTAEECWDHCCCFSVAQRLAWAREHNVQPPEHFLARLDDSDLTLALAEDPPERSRACCEHEHAETNSHCAGDARGECQNDHCAAHPDEAQAAGGFVLAIGPLARQCRGLVDMWSTCGAVLPAPGAIEWNFEWVVVEWLATATDPLNSQDLAPPVPPPRV